MPAVGAAIGAAVAGITTTQVVVFAATTALSIGLGAYQQSQARKAQREAEQAQRDAYNASLKDRYVTVRSGVSTRRYVLGRVRVGGTLMHIEANGHQNTALDSVLALACNKCELEGWYLGDEYVSAADFPGDRYGHRRETEHRTGQTVVSTAGHTTIALEAVPYSGTVTAVGSAGINVTGWTVTGASIEVYYDPVQPEVAPNAAVYVMYKTLDATKIRMIYKNGDPDQTSEGWGDVATPMWTSDHRLRGVAYARMLNLWDEDVYHAGAPQVSAVLRGGTVDGHPFFDPRTNTYPAYTTNPALLSAWYMTLPRSLGGMGIPDSWIDWPYVSTAANICDELIRVRTLDGSGYEYIKRYECHAIIDTANPPVQNLKIIMSAMAGDYTFSPGIYRIFAGAFRTATVTLTDDDIVADKALVMDKSGQNDAPANIVTSTFVNAARNFTESSPRPIRNEAYISADGAESPLDLPLPATTDERQAAYLMGVALESARPAFVGTVTVLGIGEDLAVMDTVQINISNGAAYAGRTFEIVSRVDNWDGTFDLTLQEIRANIWSLDPDTYLPTDPTPIPDTSYLWNVAPVTGFAISAQKPQALADGTAVVRVDLSWDEHPQPYVRQGGRIELRYRAPGGDWIWLPPVAGSETGTSFTGALIDGLTYQFQARAINGVGAVSNWTDGWQEYDGIIGAPPALTSLTATGVVAGINLAWTFPGTRNAIRHTELRYGTSSDFGESVLLGQFAWPTNRHNLLGLAHGATLYFWGRLIDENGTPSPWYPEGAGVAGQTSSDPSAILALIDEYFVSSALGDIMQADIEDISVRILDIHAELGSQDESITLLNGAIGPLSQRLEDYFGAAQWENNRDYPAGALVQEGGRMYRAKADVPAGTPTSTETYWQDIGAYESITDLVTATAFQVGENTTNIQTLDGSVTAISGSVTALGTRVGDVESGLVSEATTRANADTALAGRATTIEARMPAGSGELATAASVTAVESASVGRDNALAGRAEAIEARLPAGSGPLATSAMVTDEATARASADQSLAKTQTALSSMMRDDDGEGLLGDVLAQHATRAQIIAESETLTTQMVAIARENRILQAQMGTTVASVETISEAMVDVLGEFNATYAVKLGVDVNGTYYTAGYGIGLSNTGGVVQSQFVVIADRFAVMPAIGGAPEAVFAIQGGQAIIREALIGELSAAHITYGSMDGDRINTNSLNANRIIASTLEAVVGTFTTAYVKTANIGTAVVQRLQLAGGAATVGASYSFGTLDQWIAYTWLDAGVGYITLPEASEIVIHAHITITGGTDEGAVPPPVSTANGNAIQVRITCNGNELIAEPPNARIAYEDGVMFRYRINVNKVITAIAPGISGSNTIRVQWQSGSPEHQDQMSLRLFILSRHR